jgi:hypothetical protein
MSVGKYVPATADFPNNRKETAMNAKPTLARPRFVTTVAAAALSTVIAIGLLTAFTGLFQRDGAPFEQVVIAEQACANHAFISEREACVRLYLTASRVPNVASR